MSELYLYRNIIRTAFENAGIVRVSSQQGGVITPMYRALVEGSAKHSLAGTFNGGDTKSGYLQITAVGSDFDTILAGVQAMPTQVVPGSSNKGNGTCVVNLCGAFQLAGDIILACISNNYSADVEATGTSADKAHEAPYNDALGLMQLGAKYRNNDAVSGEVGIAGNGCQIIFTKAGSGYPWSTTTPGGHLVAVAAGPEAYEVTFNGDVSADFSDGNLIEIGSSGQVHIIYPSVRSTTNAAFIWPRPWTGYAIGDALKLVSATSGFQIVCKNAAGATLQTYLGVDTGGGELPIRTLKDVIDVLNNGYGTDGGGVLLPVTGYELDMSTSGIAADGSIQVAQVETITMSGGENQANAQFMFSIEGFQLDGFSIEDDSAEHAISFGGTDYVKVTITPGTKAFRINDNFKCSGIQAQARYSWDEKATWTAVDVNDGAGAADQDTDAYISIGNGMLWKVVTDYDTIPFVVDDELYFLAFYEFGWRNLLNNELRKPWRSRICSNAQVILVDLGTGNAELVDTLAIAMHNLTIGATVVVYAVGDDVEKIYGTVTTVPAGANPTLTLNPVTVPADTELSGGYIVFNSGGAAGKAYLAGSNIGALCPVTGNPYSDGARNGDEYIMIPPSGYRDFTSTTGTTTVAELFAMSVASIASPAGYTSRGWVITITDTANVYGYLEAADIRIGAAKEIANADGYALCRVRTQSIPIYRERRGLTATGDDRRSISGVKQWMYQILYPWCHEDYARLTIRTMIDYCKNFESNRNETVIFWEDSDSMQEFKVCHIEAGDQHDLRKDGKIYEVGFRLVTLEVD